MTDTNIMNDMVDFTSTITTQCRDEALHATEIVIGTLNQLTNNDDVTNSIQDTIAVLKDEDSDQTGSHKAALNDLAESISNIGLQDLTVQQKIGSILQQLQFQDYVSQQMDVLIHLLNHWLVVRSTLGDQKILEKDQLTEFGNQLIGFMVSEKEKLVVQQYIPDVTVETPAEEEDDIFLF